jgi:spore maturation protein CgeB
VDYFLGREDERLEMARRSHERTVREHSYRHRLERILEAVFK